MNANVVIAFVPHIFLVTSTLIIAGLIALDYLKHKQRLEVMLSVFDKNDEVDPQAIAALVRPRRLPFADLRRGAVFIGIGVSAILLANQMESGELRKAVRGLAAFPLILGGIYMLFQLLPKAGSNDHSG